MLLDSRSCNNPLHHPIPQNFYSTAQQLIGKRRCHKCDNLYNIIIPLYVCTCDDQIGIPTMESKGNSEPGGGIRSTRTTTAFKAINFELFARPVS